jgi:TonB family protein
LFFHVVASIVLLSGFVNGQTPAPVSSNTPSGAQHKTSDPVQSTSKQPAESISRPDPAVILPTAVAPSQAPGQVLEKIGKDVSAPVPTYTPEAKYTREARKKKIQGHCLVSIIVDAAGVPQNPRVVRPVGYGLDESALAAVKKYKFKPAMKDGHPVAVQMTIEVNFRLY